MSEKSEGTVKWFDSEKRFGFIEPSDGSGNVFVHMSQVEAAGLRGLVEGQRVAFTRQPPRGNGKADAAHDLEVLR